MAYGAKYRFNFQTDAGLDCYILILKDGYTGNTTVRPLGASPVLRMDNGGAVRGTSLEITAECQTDMEFAELYTSSPLMFKVEFYVGTTLRWSGFVSPELYSEPDIAPPYDVKIIATDGLGELKLHNCPEFTNYSILSHIQTLLSYTGLSHDVYAVSSLRAGELDTTNTLRSVNVDLSFFTGDKTCYDALVAILDTMNAFITLYQEKWVIIRETDFVVNSRTHSVQAINQSNGTAMGLAMAEIGQMRVCDWWPVGQLNTDVVPAKKGQVVRAQNRYVDSVLTNSDMSSDSFWTKSGGATFDTGENAFKLIPGSAISQSTSFGAEVGFQLLLRVKIRNAGAGSSTEGTPCTLMIHATGRRYGSGTSFYLTNGSGRDGEDTGLSWSTDSSKRVTLEVPVPGADDTEAEATELELVIPLYHKTTRDYVYATALEIAFENAGTDWNQYVYSCKLDTYAQSAGWENTIEINNGARGEGELKETLFSRVTSQGILYFQYGIPVTSGAVVADWSTSKFEGLDYLSLISRDLAVGMALPRLRKSGTLNVPTTDAGMPLSFTSADTLYFPESMSWNILRDELDVTLLSAPDATISVSSEKLTPIPEQGGNHSSSGGTGGGGGGGGSTVTWTQIVTTGTKIATIDIGGTVTDVFAPNGGSGGSTVSWGTESGGGVPLTVDGTTKTLALKSALSNYLPLAGGNMSGNLNMMGNSITLCTYPTAVDCALYADSSENVYLKAYRNLYLSSSQGNVYINGSVMNSVSWGTESGGGVQLAVGSTTKTLALKSALDNYLPLAGGTMTGSILPNSTSVNLGSSTKVWGEIHAQRWYPAASDTTHYIEYTSSGFVVHGNIAASGSVAAGA